MRGPLLRPTQRVRPSCFGTEFSTVRDRRLTARSPASPIVSMGPAAVRVGRSSNCGGTTRPLHPRRRRGRSRARRLGHGGEARHLLDGYRCRGHRGHRVRVRPRATACARRQPRSTPTVLRRSDRGIPSHGSRRHLGSLGSNMTKFGKHPDRGPASTWRQRPTMGLRLADGGVTMADVGVMGVGNLMAAGAGVGQQLQKQVGQTGIPVLQRRERAAPPARRRCASRSWPSRPVRPTSGLAVGVEKLAGAGLLGQAGAPEAAAPRPGSRRGRYGALGPHRGPHRHRDHAGCVRTGGHGVRPQVRRNELRAVRPDPPRRTTRTPPSTRSPHIRSDSPSTRS